MGFELWHQGVKLSKDTSIKVEWHASAPPQKKVQVSDPVFDMSTLNVSKMATSQHFPVNEFRQ